MKAVKVVTVVLVGAVVFGLIVQRLWNWVVPPVIGWRSITFAQALALLVLSKLLFGGFHRHGGGRGWKRGMGERWARMAPEDRERFRSGLRGKAGCRWDRADEPTPEQITK